MTRVPGMHGLHPGIERLLSPSLVVTGSHLHEPPKPSNTFPAWRRVSRCAPTDKPVPLGLDISRSDLTPVFDFNTPRRMGSGIPFMFSHRRRAVSSVSVNFSTRLNTVWVVDVWLHVFILAAEQHTGC